MYLNLALVRFVVIILLTGLSFNLYSEENKRKASVFISGKVIDTKTSEGIPFASIYVPEMSFGATSDADGRFTLLLVAGVQTKVTISYLGYQSLDTLITPSEATIFLLKLVSQDFSLAEVVVTSKENVNGNSTSLIEKTALEHIQPSSFADILQLLPGHSTEDSDLRSPKRISMRQVGTDANTSLGTAFVVNGTQLTNDNFMQNIKGKSSDESVYGIDMRTIATDRIESIEIVRGIPSVKHGDLTAGLVKIELKGGYTPWEGRVKADLKNKLFSVGKGLVLPNKRGLLNLDLDYARYAPDPRSDIDVYTRSTFSARYENNIALNDKTMLLTKTNLSYTGSFDRQKKDPDVLKGKEDTSKESYNNYLISTSGRFQRREAFVKELNYNLSMNYVRERSDIKKLVTPSGVSIVPNAMTEGAHDAEFLAGEYTSYLTVDGQPLNLRAELNAKSDVLTGKLKQDFLYGAEFRYDKNLGEGAVYDLTKPPYLTGKSSSRPYAFNEVPALQKIAFYLEDNILVQLGKWMLKAEAGVRATTMLGLSPAYSMHHRLYWEPRLNAKLIFPEFSLFGQTSSFALTGGYGRLYKFPTQNQLFPTQLYYDYIQLNYYSLREELRALNVKTEIEDPTNFKLCPALNTKYETGFTLTSGKIRLDVTLFDERMKNGFTSNSDVLFHTYTNYDESSVNPANITSKPALSDFTSRQDTIISSMGRTQNTAAVYKRGFEYTLNLGAIPYIYTNVSLNGAWFQTKYELQGERYNVPHPIYLNDKPYPYMGIYEYGQNDNVKSQLNTNLRLDTHIPNLRMLFSSSLETMWFERGQKMWNDGLPVSFWDVAGTRHPFETSMLGDPLLKSLQDTYTPYTFLKGKVPIAMSLNLKMTKEIGKILKMSFYVNRVLNYLPEYISIHGTKIDRAHSSAGPAFGAEITLKI